MADTSRTKPGTERMASPNILDSGTDSPDPLADPTKQRHTTNFPRESSPNPLSPGSGEVEGQDLRGYVHGADQGSGESVTNVSRNRIRSIPGPDVNDGPDHSDFSIPGPSGHDSKD